MPFPIVIAIIVAAVALLSAGALRVWWDDLVVFLKGKKVVILGGIETGKTTMHAFLRDGELRVDHIATDKEKVKKNRLRLGDLSLDLKEGVDISGQEDYKKEWKQLFLDCDICLYMFDVSKVYSEDETYIARINAHLSHIGEWQKELSKPTQMFVIGGFADLVGEYKKLTPSNKQDFEQQIRQKIKKAYMKVDLGAGNIIIGSMVDQAESEKLVYTVLRYINFK
jgi:GTPase SAR1 family protein